MSGLVRLERLRRIDHEVREFYEVTDTGEAAAWVRSLGHEAASVEADGFRYRSIYPDGQPSRWAWVERGQWLVHMHGDKQDPELDLPSDDGPQAFRDWMGEWMLVPESPVSETEEKN